MDAVDRAFEAVPRAEFLPEGERARADHDGPISLGHGSTNSQPRTVADMLRLLDVHAGDRVLDIGAGSGWTTALLAHLTGSTGSVLGLEIEPEVADWGAANVRRAGFAWAWLETSTPDVLGDPERAPYDRILVSADAADLPRELVDQIAEDGCMVVPVRSVMTRVVRRVADLELSEHGRYRFVPLQ